ncbi:MAG: topoisomerase C-terminal repeat-containing protein [Clostridia bacterium]|nr:topoisomerase C-terminal repeat-containing protein [Clostridia bacterium]
MILIIAEKPSLARNIVAGIGQMRKLDGYYEGQGYLVTWAFGHLFALCDIETYQPSPDGSMRWSMANIPCFPRKYQFELRRKPDKTVDAGVERQFALIRSLCHRDDVEMIVNAGDADREGEIIIRLCIRQAEAEGKPQMRLWLPDQTPQTVQAALAELRPAASCDNLANEGYARTLIDWLYGVNLTRYATLKTGHFLRVGRVIVPIVKAVYDRDMAIRNFKPEIYYAPVSRAETGGEPVELTSKKRFSRDELAAAEALCRRYNQAGATVTAVKRKKSTLPPGKLYSLSKLQNVLGKTYKMPMDKSLEIVQRLYERGYLTYPRTNSEYLATAEKDKIRDILAGVAKLGYPVAFRADKTVFDDSKIESHSALTPTYKIPDKAQLSPEEAQVYGTVMRRFVAVFCAEPCRVEKSEITIDVGGLEQFTLKGTVILEPGWTKYDHAPQKDKILPKLAEGDAVNIEFRPAEKETSPPKHYTIETLNNYLKNPFREDKAALDRAAEAREEEGEGEDDDAAEYRAIFEGLELGTEATRTGIIENAIKSEYIALKKDVYTILPGGEFLIESLSRMGISMDKYKTVELGRALKRIYRGEWSIKAGLYLAEQEISAVFHREEQPLAHDTDDGVIGDAVGTCPLCGSEVRRTSFGYGCAGYREKGCKFGFRNVICGRTVSLRNARLLLEQGRTGEIVGFTGKSGRSFNAALALRDGRVVFDFPDSAPSAEPPPPPEQN